LLIPHSLLAYISAFAMLTVAFVAILARTTKGGWRWRWGERE
jgi:hypothetical protein